MYDISSQPWSFDLAMSNKWFLPISHHWCKIISMICIKKSASHKDGTHSRRLSHWSCFRLTVALFVKNFLNFDFNKCSDGVPDNQFARTPVAVGEWV